MSQEPLSPDLKIDVLKLKKAALVYRAVNHQLRQQMLQLIHRDGQLTVTRIHHTLGLEQSVASQHLAILRRAGYVTTRREGKYIYYSVNEERLVEIQAIGAALLN